MPHTINGIGTWYWGKDRIYRRSGVCEFCGSHVELSSYDTTLFFVVVFVPIIPLGRKRVVNDCSSCRRHRAMSLKKWIEAQEKDILAANEAAMKDPHNEEKAATAIGTAIAYHANEEFVMLAEKYDRQFPRGAVVQAVLGDGYAHFGMSDRAATAYEKSLSVKNEPAVHETLAVMLMRGNRPAEALPHVRHILDQKLADRVVLLGLMASSFQAQGMHAEALKLMDDSAATFPQLAGNRDFTKLRGISEKHRTSGRRIQSKALREIGGPTMRQGGWRGKLPRLIPVAIVGVLIAWYLSSAIKLGLSRPVHLVNGLESAYTVNVSGNEYRLPPHSHRAINVAEGDLTIRVLDPKTQPAPSAKTVTIRTPFFSRPFDNTVHVINPDGTALLVRDQTVYSAGGGGGEQPYSLYAGRFYYAVKSVDYLFEPFPREIKLPGADSQIVKSRLHLVGDITPLQLVSFLLDERHRHMDWVCDVLRNRLELIPVDGSLVVVASSLMPPDQAEKLLRPRLASRPLLMEWHRAYQELMERAHPDHDVRAEYEKLLAAEPTNAELTYLLGRVTDDRSAARALFQKAAAASPPVAYAHHALSYNALIRGDFPAALDSERKALAISPGNVSFQAYEQGALEAQGRYPELLQRVRQKEQAAPTSGDLVEYEMYLLARSGDLAGARRRASQHYDSIRNQSSEQGLIDLRLDHDAMLAYVQRDEAAYAKALDTMQRSQHKFARALQLRHFGEAEAAVKSAAREDAGGYVPIYLAADDAGDASAAKSALDKAVAVLTRGDKGDRAAAKWLGSGGADPGAEELNDLGMTPEDKRIILAAVGLRRPSIRPQCFALARKLNYDTRFPYLLVDRVISK